MIPEVSGEDVMIRQLKESDVIIDYRSRAWCKLPYPNHPKGCPNLGKKDSCPPEASLFERMVKPPFTLVAVRFDLGAHTRRMKERHPDWSDRRARCLLYWQKKVNKRLKEVCERAFSDIENVKILYSPEANGVHVFGTCRNIGLILERNPKKIVWKVAIIGIKK